MAQVIIHQKGLLLKWISQIMITNSCWWFSKLELTSGFLMIPQKHASSLGESAGVWKASVVLPVSTDIFGLHPRWETHPQAGLLTPQEQMMIDGCSTYKAWINKNTSSVISHTKKKLAFSQS